MTRLPLLHQVLIERLPHINRWQQVEVCTYEDAPKLVQDRYEPNIDNAYIIWSDPKTKWNTNFHEIKEFPLSDIDKLISRNQNRLNNERKQYK